MGRNLKLEDKFTFSCHDQLACFKKCCRDINIFLTPYDVLRMRKKMQISSGDFLNKHTHVLKSPHSGFPVVILKMREDDLVCPFITDKGCQVYDVRPWSCRMAPVEVRGTGEFGIAFEESRCHGLKETKEWTVNEWMENQGLAAYHEPEELFGQIPLKVKRTGDARLDQVVMDMIFTGCYDLDRFRKLLADHPDLLDDQPQYLIKEIMEDDVALMKFAFRWLPVYLNDVSRLKELARILNQ